MRRCWRVVGLCLLNGLVCCSGIPIVHAGTYNGGTGASGDPYIISSTADWLELIATESDWNTGKHFVLTADIDFENAYISRVGDGTTHFNGVLDGAGHIIRNATIDHTDEDNVGLIGYLNTGGEIKNLGLENVDVIGRHYVGGLVGQLLSSTITNCYVIGSVVGSTRVGGLSGIKGGGTIANCYTAGTINGVSAWVGGLIGNHGSGTINRCYSLSAVVGSSYVGGLVGVSGGVITGCFWDTQTSSQGFSAGGKGLTTLQMQTVSIFQNAGWGNGDWVMTEGQYPRLAWEDTGAAPIPAPQPIPLTGQGTEAEPYLITTATEFSLLSWYMDALDKYFRLEEDLDLSEQSLYPIGDLDLFCGKFNGNNHVLSNAMITLPQSNHVGIFARMGTGANIYNLTLANIDITGMEVVGGLVGRTLSGNITNCYATGIVIAHNNYVGGLVGIHAGGMIEACYTNTEVTGNLFAGGLVGMQAGAPHLKNCYAIGSVTGTNRVGGLIGRQVAGTTTQCYATGSVNGSTSLGGLIGLHDGGSVFRCFWNTETTQQSLSGGGIGLTTAQMQSVSIFQNAGWGSGGWVMEMGQYPRLDWEETGADQIPEPEPIPLVGNGTSDDPYLIRTPEEFTLLSWHIQVVDKYLHLTTDLDLAEKTIYPIQEFNGVFDGNGKTLHNIVIYQPSGSYIGVFTSLGNEGVIRDLEVKNISVSGYRIVGGIVGLMQNSIIENCHVTGTVAGNSNLGGIVGWQISGSGQIANCSVAGAINGGTLHIGGIAGEARGTIQTSYVTATIEGNESVGAMAGYQNGGMIKDCAAFGSVAGNSRIGGLVGYQWGGTITKCYSTVTTIGSSSVGGLVGFQDSGTVTACYWNTDVYGNDNGFGEGRTTAEMTWPYDTSENTSYDGWDFAAIWAHDTDLSRNAGYPLLGWQVTLIVEFNTDGTPDATIEGLTTQLVAYTANTSPVTAVAPLNYHFTRWTSEGGVVSSDNPLVLENVTLDQVLTAEFAEGPLPSSVPHRVWQWYE